MSFQSKVVDWANACFGERIASDKQERNHRFIEEALELMQSHGVTRDEVLQLVNYVYNRPVGEPLQELGGVMCTLAALSGAYKYDMQDAGEVELKRVWEKLEIIREKQRKKPRFSPLPVG